MGWENKEYPAGVVKEKTMAWFGTMQLREDGVGEGMGLTKEISKAFEDDDGFDSGEGQGCYL